MFMYWGLENTYKREFHCKAKKILKKKNTYIYIYLTKQKGGEKEREKLHLY
jgi:hypothetical protein